MDGVCLNGSCISQTKQCKDIFGGGSFTISAVF